MCVCVVLAPHSTIKVRTFLGRGVILAGPHNCNGLNEGSDLVLRLRVLVRGQGSGQEDVGMGRVRGRPIHFVNESPHTDRSASVCVCG